MDQQDQFIEFITQRKWLPVSVIVIGFIVRLVKSDTKLPIDIPPRARVWLALGLGILSGVLEKLTQGIAWEPAIIGGLLAAGTAAIGHDLIIASIRGGQEFPLPGLTIPGAEPSPGSPPTIPPPPPGESVQ